MQPRNASSCFLRFSSFFLGGGGGRKCSASCTSHSDGVVFFSASRAMPRLGLVLVCRARKEVVAVALCYREHGRWLEESVCAIVERA